jgi:diguanylate cyclase (GGDEF)-like protein
MNTGDRNGQGPALVGNEADGPAPLEDARRTLDKAQTASDRDQTAADADQTHADADQTASANDQGSADSDQRASDRDQATADRDHAADTDRTPESDVAYDTSRDARESGSAERLGNRLERAGVARDRDATAAGRDKIAQGRDGASLVRDARAAELEGAASEPESVLLKQLEELAAEAAADRAHAAADRARAALDRANAARERARLEAELRLAHLDELTGAYRREMGRLALTHEIERARRSDARFVLAFVDVDGLKDVNDRDGHAAGDRVLQVVVDAIRSRLRSFDPIVRYGGDEFVCGLSGTDTAEASRRFEAIGLAIKEEAGVGISVGFAELAAADTAEELTGRADAAMLEVKAAHHQRR